MKKAVLWLVAMGFAVLGAEKAAAQSSSLYGDPRVRHEQMSVADASWTYEMSPDHHQFKVHDQITIVVNEKSMVSSKGGVQGQRQGSRNISLTNWILFGHGGIIPDPQSSGAPTIGATVNNQEQSQVDLETKDAMTFKIAVNIVEKRPNGYLVVEGHRSIVNNEETWEQCVTGVVRSDDVLPNNTVLSENVAELKVFKREGGMVHESYRRGWMFKWFDKYSPF